MNNLKRDSKAQKRFLHSIWVKTPEHLQYRKNQDEVIGNDNLRLGGIYMKSLKLINAIRDKNYKRLRDKNYSYE